MVPVLGPRIGCGVIHESDGLWLSHSRSILLVLIPSETPIANTHAALRVCQHAWEGEGRDRSADLGSAEKQLGCRERDGVGWRWRG